MVCSPFYITYKKYQTGCSDKNFSVFALSTLDKNFSASCLSLTTLAKVKQDEILNTQHTPTNTAIAVLISKKDSAKIMATTDSTKEMQAILKNDFEFEFS